MRRLSFPALVILSVVCTLTVPRAFAGGPDTAPPDTVTLKNGDRISGTLVHVDRDLIRIHSAALGELSVGWTYVSEIRSHGHAWHWIRELDKSSSPSFVLQNAVMRLVDYNVLVEDEWQTLTIPGSTSLEPARQEHPAAGLTQLMSAKPRSTSPNTSLVVSLNAPESTVIATQSQYVFGGSFRVLHNSPDLCSAPSWYSSLLAAANHNKSFKIGNPAVVTDTYDGTLSLTNKLGANTHFAGYGVADLFGNSALGIGLQQSYGMGITHTLYTNGCVGSTSVEPKGHRLTLNGDASLRYIHQRLYSPGGSHNLAGFRLSQDLLYVLYSKSAAPKELLTISESLWAIPMLNDAKAVEAGGSFGFSVPFTKSLSAGISTEDDFFNNAPKAKRKNYLKNALTVTYTFPAPATP